MPPDTLYIASGRAAAKIPDTVNLPLQRASTVLFGSLAEMEAVQARFAADEPVPTYGIVNMPLRHAVEQAISAIEGGYRAVTVPSGLAAVAVALLSSLQAGDHLLMVDSCYSPTRALCDGLLKDLGIRTTYYDPLIGSGIAKLLEARTRAVYTESPGSITFEVQDIPAIARAAHQHGATVLLDNAWATGQHFQPFAHGVDLVVQPATKYYAGHSDLLVGLVIASEAAWPRLRAVSQQLGQTTSPDDLYLLLRSLRTMPVRLARHAESALAVARWLQSQPEVARVLYPALPDDPGHALWKRDFTGATGLLGVALTHGSRAQLAAMLDHYRHFGIGYSWGGFESLVMLYSGLRSDPAGRQHRPWTGGPLLRYHIGLESVEDLIADLADGFARFRAAA
jgi:cystathionine beta-lyase